MRGLITIGLLGCLFFPLAGCQKPAAADEIEVKQRASAVLPGLDGTIKVRVGDIKRGKMADVEILGPDSVILASKTGAQVGDRIAFAHDGKQYQLEVLRFRDDIGSGDWAKFRVIPPEGANPTAARKDPPKDISQETRKDILVVTCVDDKAPASNLRRLRG